MKLQAILFAAVASLSFGAHAEGMEMAPGKTMMKPHSHLEEKTYHFHPRDGGK